MTINEFTQYFDNPAVSSFNRSTRKGLPVRIGPLYPLKWDFLNYGNSGKGSSAHNLRVAPLLAPTFTDLRLQEHSAIVPLRVIMKDFEERFNLAKYREGASLPHITITQYMSVLKAMCKIGISPIGSLFDYTGHPVFADLYKALFTSVATGVASSDKDIDDFYIPSSTAIKNLFTQTVTYRDQDYTFIFFGFVSFVAYHYFNVSTDNFFVSEGDSDLLNPTVVLNHITRFYNANSLSGTPTLGEIIKASNFDTIKEATDAYLNWKFLNFVLLYASQTAFPSQNYTTLPQRAYFRFCIDWNRNGNFVDRDVELEEMVYNYEDRLVSLAGQINSSNSPASAVVNSFKRLVTLENRLWDSNDFFTSLLPTSSADIAIEIPANSTVLDLAKYSALQKLVLRLSYSSRYRDVIWNVFKIKPSDARLQQSYPIKQTSHNIGVGETLQTSATDVSGVLGDFAGRAYSSGSNKGYHIFCEEPCIIFDFVSFVPRADYADALHPLIHLDDTLDIPIPDMDVLGNQPIYADLASGNPLDADVVMGYGRQYQEWLANYNTVHGEFKTTLDYWQLTRRFSDVPVLNDDFLRIHPADDLDKIFSVKDTPHAYLNIFYSARVTRHVHRNVRIQI